MSRAFFAAVLLLAAVRLAAADDKPKPPAPPAAKPPANAPLTSVGQIEGRLTKASADAITIKVVTTQGKGGVSVSGSGRVRLPSVQITEKELDFDVSDKVLVRTHDLPKGPDGKAKSLTPDEHQKLREPAGAPGYKADYADLHAGQGVRLYLSKAAGKDSTPVVTTVMILVEGTDKKPDKPKK